MINNSTQTIWRWSWGKDAKEGTCREPSARDPFPRKMESLDSKKRLGRKPDDTEMAS